MESVKGPLYEVLAGRAGAGGVGLHRVEMTAARRTRAARLHGNPAASATSTQSMGSVGKGRFSHGYSKDAGKEP